MFFGRTSFGLALALAASLAACGGGGGGAITDGGGALTCNVDAPTSCPAEDAPTYATTIRPIIVDRCVPCHDGKPDGPWPLHTYDQIVDWYDVVRADLLNCSMPPADGGVPMTDDERHAVLTWLRCNTPP